MARKISSPLKLANFQNIYLKIIHKRKVVKKIYITKNRATRRIPAFEFDVFELFD